MQVRRHERDALDLGLIKGRVQAAALIRPDVQFIVTNAANSSVRCRQPNRGPCHAALYT
jgi:hypothetical protein